MTFAIICWVHRTVCAQTSPWGAHCKAFGMSQIFYAGFVVTSCVGRAQLSSYASFLSKGDVALSILLARSANIASVLFTPLLTGLLIGSAVPVVAIAMSKSILQVVLVPITLGLALNTYAKPVVTFLRPIMPVVAMICTSLCIGSPIAINRSQILSAEGLHLVLPVLTFHAVAFASGYWISKIPALRSWQDDLIMHRNAKLHLGRASSHPVPWEQSSCSTCMLSCCYGCHGSLSCLFLGQWLAKPGTAILAHTKNWIHCQRLRNQQQVQLQALSG